jgi:hypothetical protein
MWPFRKRKKPKSSKRKMMETVITGVIIGAAISSIVGKKLLDKHGEDDTQE